MVSETPTDLTSKVAIHVAEYDLSTRHQKINCISRIIVLMHNTGKKLETIAEPRESHQYIYIRKKQMPNKRQGDCQSCMNLIEDQMRFGLQVAKSRNIKAKLTPRIQKYS